jgi:hypothetical protein
MALANLGFPDQAVVRAREAVALARGTPFEPVCHDNVAITYLNLGHWELAREHAEAALSSQAESDLLGLTQQAKVHRAFATAMLDDLNKGIAEIRQAFSNQPVVQFRAMALRYLALACVKAGHAAEGLKALDEFDISFPHPLSSELTRGELLLVQDPPDEGAAERCFRHVIDLAREQKARLFELRAATCLARLLKNRGEIQEAGSMLADIYAWFTEGFDSRDLKDARALLDELRS